MTDNAPQAKARRKVRWPRREDVVSALLLVNLVGVATLGVRAWRGDKPVVVTVGVTQLARDQMARLATANIGRDEARARTQLFLAVAQEVVKSAASRKGIVVMPRECVLAGEYADITDDVAKAVEATLARRPPAAPAAPTPALEALLP